MTVFTAAEALTVELQTLAFRAVTDEPGETINYYTFLRVDLKTSDSPILAGLIDPSLRSQSWTALSPTLSGPMG